MSDDDHGENKENNSDRRGISVTNYFKALKILDAVATNHFLSTLL